MGIHDYPDRKTGRLPAVDKPALMLRDFLTVVPDHPLVDPAPGFAWPMDFNDQWGDCVVAGLDHALETIHTLLEMSWTNWSRDQIIAYYRTQNPTFDPSTGAGDEGMVIQLFLEHLVKQGVILGFAKVDPQSEEEMKAAVYLGLAVVTGEELTQAQHDQQVWDYVAGDADWGGHCTTTVGYEQSPDYQFVVTWGQLVPETRDFIQRQVSEAWFILTQAHVDHPAFRAGFDLPKFAQAYQQITGSPFPVPVTPPAPGPAPLPTPPPPPHHHHHHRHWWEFFTDILGEPAQ